MRLDAARFLGSGAHLFQAGHLGSPTALGMVDQEGFMHLYVYKHTYCIYLYIYLYIFIYLYIYLFIYLLYTHVYYINVCVHE